MLHGICSTIGKTDFKSPETKMGFAKEGQQRLRAEVLALKQESRILGQWSNPVSIWFKRAKPVLHGPNSTESNLFHNEAKSVAENHWLRLSPSVALLRGQVWSSLGIRCQQQQLVD